MAHTDPKTFAETMVVKYETLLARHAGQKSVTVDGQTLTLAQLEELYDHLLTRYRRLNGDRPRIAAVKMN